MKHSFLLNVSWSSDIQIIIFVGMHSNRQFLFVTFAPQSFFPTFVLESTWSNVISSYLPPLYRIKCNIMSFFKSIILCTLVNENGNIFLLIWTKPRCWTKRFVLFFPDMISRQKLRQVQMMAHQSTVSLSSEPRHATDKVKSNPMKAARVH